MSDIVERCSLCDSVLVIEVDGHRFVSATHDNGSATSISVTCLEAARALTASRAVELEAAKRKLADLMNALLTWRAEVVDVSTSDDGWQIIDRIDRIDSLLAPPPQPEPTP